MLFKVSMYINKNLFFVTFVIKLYFINDVSKLIIVVLKLKDSKCYALFILFKNILISVKFFIFLVCLF